MDKYEYIGHLHIHSTFSDGSGSIQEIARAGREAGLDFIGITDHNTLAGREEGFEGWQDDILVLIGMELGREKNHYIAFGVQRPIPADDGDPRKLLMLSMPRVDSDTWLIPVKRAIPPFWGKFFAWDRWDVENFTGLEIWNFSSIWREISRSKLVVLFWYLFDRYRGARFPEPETLKKWDTLARKRPVTAFAGSDAHAIPFRLGFITLYFFAYSFLFRTINTHLLLEEELDRKSGRAVEQVLEALRRGNFFIGSDHLDPARGFRFSAFNGDEEVNMGGEILRTPQTVLRIISPSNRGLVRIICNGELVYESRKKVIIFKVLQAGVFRVEIYRCPRLGKPVP